MLTQLVVLLNSIANAIAAILLAPVAWLPGWLSATLIASVTGVVMLVIFKFTSNQSAIGQTRNQIKANLLALSLFKDSLPVGLRAQLALLGGGLKLLSLSLVPMLVMIVPTCLVLGQLSLWYQARPLAAGEETVVTVHLAASAKQLVRDIQLVPCSLATVTAGPVRVASKNMVCWNIQAQGSGQGELVFEGGGQHFSKGLAVGHNYMRVSLQRPRWDWYDVLLHPHEPPFAADSAVQSIEVTYPSRQSWTAGTNSWLIYWFLMSMVAAFVARPFLGVKI